MLRFMICDTDTAYANKLGSILHELYSPCTVEYMYGPAALEVSLRADSGGADILITEIELRDQSAISIIAEHLKGSSPLQVIYMTKKMEYCTEVYDTQHCGFLVKPINMQLLMKSIQRAVDLLNDRKSAGIVVQKGGSVHVVDIRKLHYIEGKGRIARLVMAEDVLETYEKLSSFEYRLDRRFLHCHKSYVVNMDYVRRFTGDGFLMANGFLVPISQSKRKEARQVFLEYMGNCAIQQH